MNFAAPLVLLGFLALPFIWWILRTTPSNVRKEIFPPLRLLVKQMDQNAKADRIPLWLLFLRLTIATLIIIALARPSWYQNQTLLSGSQPLALIIDNGWASAKEWKKRITVAESLLNQAAKLQKSVYLIATAGNTSEEIDPLPAEVVKKNLLHLYPHPLPTNRVDALKQLIKKVHNKPIDVAYLSDGLQTDEDTQAFDLIEKLNPKTLLWYSTNISDLIGIKEINHNDGKITARVIRAVPHGKIAVTLNLYNLKNQLLSHSTAQFHEGEKEILLPFNLPLELRNEIAWIKINNHTHAAATFLVDSYKKINRVAILSPSVNEMTQPLLSPLYYVIKALQGHTELITTGRGELSVNIDYLLKQNPSVLIMGDIVNLSAEAEKKLSDFINEGGTLIRFAGEKIASTEYYDSLLPVPLRPGERRLGGTMSWTQPQKLAPFTKNSVFSDLPFPEDIMIFRQILAEPNSNLFEKTWLNLADGSPLVTATQRGKGTLVFIHVSPDSTWSNLPLSGFFAQMLQKLITVNTYDHSPVLHTIKTPQTPWRILNADGQLQIPPSFIAPLIIDKQKLPFPSYSTPPGLYGSKNNFYALNVLNSSSNLIEQEHQRISSEKSLSYDDIQEYHLTGPILGLAMLLFTLDIFLVLWREKFLLSNRKIKVFFYFSGRKLYYLDAIRFQSPGANCRKYDTATVQTAGTPHLAYVITNNNEIDATSRSGLKALSQFISEHTMLSPGPVVALDLDKDELAFYPLIYWPIDPDSPLPTQKNLEKINAFMKHGGAVLFDTRDQMNTNLTLEETANPATQKLRTILRKLNILAIEPATIDHVVSRSFYIMPDFPGRYRNSPLWVESSSINKKNSNSITTGDNVSSLFITANDFAGAWALNEKEMWKYPLIPNDYMQRLWAFRAGLNIVMYTLTGNYKADQIHVPALLERFNKEKK
ncbi:DUF4159 domain-containing protein [Bartonella ancashensis]|uniref:Membrane protein, putative n=1 Tax=Bartonella ancashensis TaxID=1318743 RepID=A0A0M4M5Z6_9HYPH|nr:DUF4159 domain-containing protein [Bartonella ancashensis]ALE03567.1 membrane protein, putative [Bartonella ancashensis]